MVDLNEIDTGILQDSDAPFATNEKGPDTDNQTIGYDTNMINRPQSHKNLSKENIVGSPPSYLETSLKNLLVDYKRKESKSIEHRAIEAKKRRIEGNKRLKDQLKRKSKIGMIERTVR